MTLPLLLWLPAVLVPGNLHDSENTNRIKDDFDQARVLVPRSRQNVRHYIFSIT
jgi:hypothetical protein